MAGLTNILVVGIACLAVAIVAVAVGSAALGRATAPASSPPSSANPPFSADIQCNKDPSGITQWFQPDFRWGVANSPFQEEAQDTGADFYNWSITHTGWNGAPGLANDFLNRYEVEFQLAAAAGMNTFRLGVAWSRINPAQGVYNYTALLMYQTIVKTAVQKYGLKPMVTLFHFVRPAWMDAMGIGVMSPQFAAVFDAYVNVTIPYLLPYVDVYLTINEPLIIGVFGTVQGIYPPGLTDISYYSYFVAVNNVLVAHALAYRTIHAYYTAAGLPVKVTFNEAFDYLYPESPGIDAEISSWAHGLVTMYTYSACTTGLVFNITVGDIPAFVPFISNPPYAFPPRVPSEAKYNVSIKGTCDFFALDMYNTGRVSLSIPGLSREETKPSLSTFNGLYDLIREAYTVYELPVFVAEIGTPTTSDAIRNYHVTETVRTLWRLRNEGVSIYGMLYWTLVDNFEWNSGYTLGYGLCAVPGRSIGDLTPVCRPAYDLISYIIKHKCVPFMENPMVTNFSTITV